MPTPDAKTYAEQWVRAWNGTISRRYSTTFTTTCCSRRLSRRESCPRPGELCAGRTRCGTTGPTALKSLPDLNFEIIGVYRGESTLVINYRNHRGELVNEVLTFDGDGLVREGHGTYLE